MAEGARGFAFLQTGISGRSLSRCGVGREGLQVSGTSAWLTIGTLTPPQYTMPSAFMSKSLGDGKFFSGAGGRISGGWVRVAGRTGLWPDLQTQETAGDGAYGRGILHLHLELWR